MERGVPIRAISRGLAVLASINRDGPISMMGISRAAQVPYPTACRIVQTLLALLWPEVNLRHIRLTVCRLSQIVSLVLLVLALVLSQSKEPALFQESPLDPQIGWFALVMLASSFDSNWRTARR